MNAEDSKEELNKINNKLDEVLEKMNKLAKVSDLEEIKNKLNEMDSKAGYDFLYMLGFSLVLASIPFAYIGALKDYSSFTIILIVVGLGVMSYSLYNKSSSYMKRKTEKR